MADAAINVAELNGIAIENTTITLIINDCSDKILLTINEAEKIRIIIMVNEKTMHIFNADVMIFEISSLSFFGSNRLINRITPVSIPILESTSQISMIAFAIE